MTTWRYIASRERAQGEEIWTVREVYTDRKHGISWTELRVEPFGTSLSELKLDLVRMARDLDSGDFLDLTLDPPAIVSLP
jgi:hypothetical protein